ncbi:MAG TPA: UDP-N-acetylmuramoyl-L-alanine--D-glutamate ligase [Acidobacteriota bacterium]|nr:UDP-N-acetylmuramoyl-L-alanine--D-glutamate ligase [Acidobacteriota bacterium]HQM64654.1 UDP-N-acetylmuramoyl-L-alanine--D-glutamate ligase [Acidobacteriota bacterium]
MNPLFVPETYVVMGLARSGLAAARQLLQRGHRVLVTDTKSAGELGEALTVLEDTARIAPGELELHLGGHPEGLLAGARAVVLSPGIPLTVPFLVRAGEQGVPIWSEVELASRWIRGTMVGITGSNGKSTTTALTAHILALSGRPAYAVGNIGQALSDFVGVDRPGACFVTELSSFQLETIVTLRPRVAAILNITPDHMDRYASLDAYAEAKWNLFKNMEAGDAAVLNAGDARLTAGAARLRCPVYTFDARPVGDPAALNGAGLADGTIWVRTGGEPVAVMPRSDIPLPGRHNLENVLAAVLMGRLLGLEPEQLAAGVRTFEPLPHRLQPVASIRGRTFYNDSKATNVDSTLLAIESFDRKILLILGGKDKGSDYAPLVRPIRERVRHVLLIGQAADKIERALPTDVPRSRCRDLADAIRTGFALSAEGDVILLSPACASFDMFDNFEHRGEVFRRDVLALKRELEP